ncbi:hypothetical protein FRC02_007769 [Tulasnella sp. 418]|nr:hypothetical protein FRC02_007769 [Tulasnella sp. 418]
MAPATRRRRGSATSDTVMQDLSPRKSHRRRVNVTSRASLPDLSDDVLVLVVQYDLSVQDLLSIRRVNKRLFAFTTLRSPWFHILNAMSRLYPLPIPTPPPYNYTQRDIETIATNAFRLNLALTSASPLPLSIHSAKAKGTGITSMKLLGGRYLLTTHKEKSSVGCKHHIRCWDILNSDRPKEEPVSKVFDLGTDNSTMFILDAQLSVVEGHRCIIIALDSAIYIQDQYQINRAVSFAVLQVPSLPAAEVHTRPGMICRLEFQVHRDDDILGRTRRPPICSLDGDLCAYSRDSRVVYVMNWKSGIVANIPPPIDPNHPLHPPGPVIQLLILGGYLLTITSRAWILTHLPKILFQNPTKGMQEPTLSPVDPLAIHTYEDYHYWTAVARKETITRPRTVWDPPAPEFEEFKIEEGEPSAAPSRLQRMISETKVSIIMYGRNHTEHGRTLEHYQVTLYDVPENPLYGPPFATLSGLAAPSASGRPLQRTIDPCRHLCLKPRLIFFHREAVSRMKYHPPITPILGPPLFQPVFGESGRIAVWLCERHAAKNPEDRLVSYVSPFPAGSSLSSPRSSVGYGPNDPDDSRNVAEGIRPLFSNDSAKKMSMSVRGDVQDATCVAFDEKLGVVCVGSGKGGIHILRYTPAWPDILKSRLVDSINGEEAD